MRGDLYLPVDGQFLGFAYPTHKTLGFHTGSVRLNSSRLFSFLSDNLEGKTISARGDSGAGVMVEGRLAALLIGGRANGDTIFELITQNIYQKLKSLLEL